MYRPQQFEETRLDVLHALMRAHPFATLLTLDESGIVADHVPLQTLESPPLGILRGHVARANPVWRQHRVEVESLALFQGPHAYISPSLYPSKIMGGEVVPTWNYAVVHAYGVLRFIHDEQWLLQLVGSLTDEHEMPRSTPWRVDDAPPAYIGKMLRGIVGIEFSVTRLIGKWKVSQNRSVADQRGVIAGLRESGDRNSDEIAAMLAARGGSAASAES